MAAAKRLSESLPITIREIPIAIPPIREAVQWDIANTNDPAIRWVVERLIAVARDEQARQGNVVPIARNDLMGREYKASSEKRNG